MATRREFLQRFSAAAGTPLAVSAASTSNAGPESGALGAAPQTPTANSDVGSLLPFIQSQALQGEFSLSYLQDRFRDVAAWRPQARGKLLELLHYSPPPCEPKSEIIERVDVGDYVRERIYFNTTPDLRVPAFLLIPKGVKFPAPAVVVLHDHGGFYFWGKEKSVEIADEHPVLRQFKQRYYAGNSIAAVLARQGYVTIVIDMFYWGERRMLLADDPADWRDRPPTITPERIAAFNQRSSQNEQLVGRTIYSAGFTWSGVMFWDDIRTVDYLITRPEVDKNRVGCVGLSVGGLRSCHLAALDDRIKAGVVVGWMASFPPQLKSKIRNTIGFTKLVPGLYRHLDYPDVASLAMPRPLLVINGSQDALFDLDGVRHCFDKLRACYQKTGVPDRFRGSLYDTPHEFNAAMQTEAWDWLKRWL
jgi:dienelactone hydrolase